MKRVETRCIQVSITYLSDTATKIDRITVEYRLVSRYYNIDFKNSNERYFISTYYNYGVR